MAKGLKCRECGHDMYADREKEERAGRTVWYVCRNGNCGWREKVFEGK